MFKCRGRVESNSCVVLAGHLDRCVSGQVAINILAACDEEKKSTSAGVPSKSKSTFGRRISHIASNLPTSAASAAVKKLRKSTHQYTSSPSASPKLSGKTALLPAFLCAHMFIERETSGYEAGAAM